VPAGILKYEVLEIRSIKN